VAATVAVGLGAIKRGLASPNGLATACKPLCELALAPTSRIELGGHELIGRTPMETADLLHRRSGLFGERLLARVRGDLREFQRNIRPGTAIGCGRAIEELSPRPRGARSGTAQQAIDRIRRDLRDFSRRNRLDRVVVINVASTEPLIRRQGLPDRWAALDRQLGKRSGAAPPASSLYAIAAIQESMPYINFTPSLGCDVPAIRELAEARGTPIMGSDGKTGETLLRSVLAPMFRARDLRVLSWTGHNILGNRDGRILAIPANKAAKLSNKEQLLASILGYRPHTHTGIDFVESLDDWKTAWDHVHFEGFLGTKMNVQFIWQACDSILAAPLVIDLARLADYHASRGGRGVMTHLACFFKAPMGVSEHSFAKQVDALHGYVQDALRR
jgi:myo-inositol-1-phosphate synthase